jgi:hypothetical protein
VLNLVLSFSDTGDPADILSFGLALRFRLRLMPRFQREPLQLPLPILTRQSYCPFCQIAYAVVPAPTTRLKPGLRRCLSNGLGVVSDFANPIMEVG